MKKNYFKPLFLSALIFILSSKIKAQDFAWMHGATLSDLQGSYGTIGTAAPTNTPGAREGAISWTDNNGDFWLFGGFGYDASSNLPGYLNDLWKYDKLTNQWTWMKGSNLIIQYGSYAAQGVSTASANPGSRGFSASWADATGNLWLFGGNGYGISGPMSDLNDLWKYNILTNQWIWMKGSANGSQVGVYGTQGLGAPANTPGARRGCVAWRDNADNLWLFGGSGFGTSGNGDLSDMWRYNIVNDVWTWIRGTGTINQTGIYGTMGVSAPANNPGGRSLASGWKDSSGDLWLFGGLGYGNTVSQNPLGDLWHYNIISDHWTWVKGSNSTSPQAGVYGTPGVAAPGNFPGLRYGSLSWRDVNGDFWLFGGIGYDQNMANDNLNDLWRYNPVSNEWKWVKGSSGVAQGGFYGTQGVFSSANVPGARLYASGWMDSSNNLWLFGGQGQDGQQGAGSMNDLWKFSNCVGPTVTITSSSPAYVCLGHTATLSASGAYTYTWNVSQTVSNTLAVTPQGSSSYSLYGTDINGCKDTVEFIQLVMNPPTIFIQNLIPEVCPGQAAPLSAGGGITYTWSTQDVGASISVTPAVTTVYSVTGTDQNGCTAQATVTQSVGCVGIKGNQSDENLVSVYPNPNKGAFTIHADALTGNTSVILLNALGQKISETKLTETDTTFNLDIPAGIYYYTVMESGQNKGSGKLVIN